MNIIDLQFLLDLAKAYIDQYGFSAIFAISLLSSLIVFVPIPYFVPLAVAALQLDPTLVALTSTIGAVIAKVIIFRISYYGGKIANDKTRKRMRPFEILVSRYGWLASFLAAATPIPDDLIYIPLGFVRYSLWKFTVSLFAGKFLLTFAMAWGSRLSFPYVQLLIDQVRDPFLALLVTTGFIAGSTIIILAIIKLNWEKLLARWISEEKD
ncbi:MAG: VTT domain-containing protein [Thaumarchaeota archaeon]|nr:VTT domain-containing protein [Nitrososphaerota archaeon]